MADSTQANPAQFPLPDEEDPSRRDVIMIAAGGFAEMHGDTLRVVTQASERPKDIDENRARESERRARERLARARSGEDDSIDVARAEASLRRALLRLRARGYAREG